MQPTHTINYNDFSPNDLCHYLEERYFTQISNNLENSKKYLDGLLQENHSQNMDLLNSLFQILSKEIQQLFSKYKILLFPHIIEQKATGICLDPVSETHQRIISLLQRIRNLMNNYVAKPYWSSNQKICCNELYTLEQSVLHVLYVKENFLWTRISNLNINESNH